MSPTSYFPSQSSHQVGAGGVTLGNAALKAERRVVYCWRSVSSWDGIIFSCFWCCYVLRYCGPAKMRLRLLLLDSVCDQSCRNIFSDERALGNLGLRIVRQRLIYLGRGRVGLSQLAQSSQLRGGKQNSCSNHCHVVFSLDKPSHMDE